MTGHTVRGSRGFVAKEGANFDCRVYLSLHRDEREEMQRRAEAGEESLQDWMRAALRRELLRG